MFEVKWVEHRTESVQWGILVKAPPRKFLKVLRLSINDVGKSERVLIKHNRYFEGHRLRTSEGHVQLRTIDNLSIYKHGDGEVFLPNVGYETYDKKVTEVIRIGCTSKYL